jgi:hypothetical protein
MELLRVETMGRPAQVQTPPGSPAFERGVLGAALSPKVIDGREHTVVQVMLDDDRPGFDRSLLDCPMVAEIQTPAGDVVTRELFDHDAFRRELHAEKAAGGDELRGVLLLSGGELPPTYLRLAFLDVPVGDIDGCDLVVVRSDRDDLIAAIDAGLADGSLSEREHRGLRTTIEQRHPA